MAIAQEELAIDPCIPNVQTKLPCETGTSLDYTCLCEQYMWHITCHDNHASDPLSQPGRPLAEDYMQQFCQSTGSATTAVVMRKHHQQRRQINSILHSVGGVVASFLSSQSVDIVVPTAIPSLPIVLPAQTTSQTSAVISSTSSTRPTPTVLSSTAIPTTASTPQSTSSPATASPSSSSTPSPGLIAGAVIGGVAVLLLLGIFVMLILRHKRRKRQTPHATPQPSTMEDGSHSRSLDETLLNRTPMTEPRSPVAGYVRNEKDIYRSSQQDVMLPQSSEMETAANVWEIDGRERERPLPSELESPTVESGNIWESGKPGGRHEHSELHF